MERVINPPKAKLAARGKGRRRPVSSRVWRAPGLVLALNGIGEDLERGNCDERHAGREENRRAVAAERLRYESPYERAENCGKRGRRRQQSGGGRLLGRALHDRLEGADVEAGPRGGKREGEEKQVQVVLGEEEPDESEKREN